jgi:uracil-DNA glycosylase
MLLLRLKGSGVSEDIRPDARKSLATLREDWSSCIKCDLGVERIRRDGKFVFGRGFNHSVMFIGEGPGVDEEQHGEPFIGRSGQLLRRVIDTLGLTDFYITNIVCCRSCAIATQADGSPQMRMDYRTKISYPVFRDEPPTPPQKSACRPRLLEEIYLVDPIVIVGLGGPACEALLGRSITITRDHGEIAQIAIPGASYRPVLTEKKQQWLRKVGKEWQNPVEQNEVYYYFVPTLHPAYVARQLSDKGPGNPFQRFVGDIRKAVQTYNSYLEAIFGVIPTEREKVEADELHHELERESE